jgi:hypothetical protein
VGLGWSELVCRELLWFMVRDGEMKRGKAFPPVSGLHMLFGEAPTKLRNTAKPDGMDRRRAAMLRCGLAIALSGVLGMSRCARRIELGPLIGAGANFPTFPDYSSTTVPSKPVTALSIIYGGAVPSSRPVPRWGQYKADPRTSCALSHKPCKVAGC